jgi:hypothetical protein
MFCIQFREINDADPALMSCKSSLGASKFGRNRRPFPSGILFGISPPTPPQKRKQKRKNRDLMIKQALY